MNINAQMQNDELIIRIKAPNDDDLTLLSQSLNFDFSNLTNSKKDFIDSYTFPCGRYKGRHFKDVYPKDLPWLMYFLQSNNERYTIRQKLVTLCFQQSDFYMQMEKFFDSELGNINYINSIKVIELDKCMKSSLAKAISVKLGVEDITSVKAKHLSASDIQFIKDAILFYITERNR